MHCVIAKAGIIAWQNLCLRWRRWRYYCIVENSHVQTFRRSKASSTGQATFHLTTVHSMIHDMIYNTIVHSIKYNTMQPKNRNQDLPSLGKHKSDSPTQNPVAEKLSQSLLCLGTEALSLRVYINLVTCIIRPSPFSVGDGISPWKKQTLWSKLKLRGRLTNLVLVQINYSGYYKTWSNSLTWRMDFGKKWYTDIKYCRPWITSMQMSKTHSVNLFLN